MGFKKGHKGFRTKDSYEISAQKLRGKEVSSRFKKGTVPWNKDKSGVMPTPWNKGLKGVIVAWNKGKKFSEESRQKMSKAKSLDKHPKWKDGISKTKGYKRIKKLEYRGRKFTAGGSHSVAEWENLKAQYNWTCPCCGRSEPLIKLTEDHIIPLTKGGSDNIENIQPLCGSCNSKKHTKIIDYRAQATFKK